MPARAATVAHTLAQAGKTTMARPAWWVSSESTSMFERLFGSRVAPLVAHFGKHRQRSPSDIDELKKLIEEMGDGK